VQSDGSPGEPWTSTALPLRALTDVDGQNASHTRPSVDAEVNSLVEKAFAQAAPRVQTEISTAEINLDDLEMDDLISVEPCSSEMIAERPACYIPESAFTDAPRAPGASAPPAERGSSISFTVLSTLAELSSFVGRDLEELAEGLTNDDAEALRKLLLHGEWPGDEEVTRRTIIHAMPVLNPLYLKSTEWSKQPLRRLIKIFLDELDPPPEQKPRNGKSKIPERPRDENLVRLAKKLRKRPPPMPVSLPPSSK